jgi:hypothetical protein
LGLLAEVQEDFAQAEKCLDLALLLFGRLNAPAMVEQTERNLARIAKLKEQKTGDDTEE